MNLECTLQRLWAKLPRLLGLKVFLAEQRFQKGFSPLWGVLLKHILLYACFVAGFATDGRIFLWYGTDILFSSLLIVIRDKNSPVRLLSCMCASLLCSMLSDLCSSIWLAWRCHETKSWSGVSAYFLAAFWSSEIFETLTEHHILETSGCF